MTYEEAIQFWIGRVNYELRSPLASDLKLDRMRELMCRLGNPHENLRVIHIAGSKGKGSTAAMLDAVLRQAGYRTGLFTSPHLSALEERIQVQGDSISRPELASLMEEVRPAVKEMESGLGTGVGITFFEIATALGFLHFVRRRVEVAVVEVGLGGRFDSTNVCRPVLVIISSISLDHTQQLGNTLTSIAFEKAGIVKSGCPTVSGARPPEARIVIERTCRQRHSPLRQLDIDFHYQHMPGEIAADTTRLPRVRVTTRKSSWPELELSLLGEHQAANAALAVGGVEHLRQQGLVIEDGAVAAGLTSVRWPARLEVMSRRPLVVLDCAHNVASIQALVNTLRESFPAGQERIDLAGQQRWESNGAGGGRRLLVFACSADKDIRGILDLLAPNFSHAYLTRYSHSSRAIATEQLMELWSRCSDWPASAHATPAEAWQAARAAAGLDDLICVTGSVFLAGELRPMIAQSDPL